MRISDCSSDVCSSDLIEEDVDSGWTEGPKGRTYVLRTIIDDVVDPALIAKPCALLRAAGDADHPASLDATDLGRDRPRRTGGAGHDQDVSGTRSAHPHQAEIGGQAIQPEWAKSSDERRGGQECVKKGKSRGS